MVKRGKGTTAELAIARITEEIDVLRRRIQKIDRGGRGCVISIIGATLVFSLIIRLTTREPDVIIGGGVIVLIGLGAIYLLAHLRNKKRVEMLTQEIEKKEQQIARFRRMTSVDPLPEIEEDTAGAYPEAAHCPYCQAAVTPDDIAGGVCPYCNSAFKFTCPRCGTPVSENATVCPGCQVVFEGGKQAN